jgi:hypothetical protein
VAPFRLTSRELADTLGSLEPDEVSGDEWLPTAALLARYLHNADARG